MALMHGKPGQYAKSEAARRFDRIMWTMFGLLCVMCFGFGLVYGHVGIGSWWVTPGLLLVGGVVFAGLRLLDKPLNAIGRNESSIYVEHKVKPSSVGS